MLTLHGSTASRLSYDQTIDSIYRNKRTSAYLKFTLAPVFFWGYWTLLNSSRYRSFILLGWLTALILLAYAIFRLRPEANPELALARTSGKETDSKNRKLSYLMDTGSKVLLFIVFMLLESLRNTQVPGIPMSYKLIASVAMPFGFALAILSSYYWRRSSTLVLLLVRDGNLHFLSLDGLSLQHAPVKELKCTLTGLDQSDDPDSIESIQYEMKYKRWPEPIVLYGQGREVRRLQNFMLKEQLNGEN